MIKPDQLETSLQLLGVLLIFPWIDDPSDADPYDGNGYGDGYCYCYGDGDGCGCGCGYGYGYGYGSGNGYGNGLRRTQKFC